MPEIYEGAVRLDLDLRAQCYTVALFAALPGQSGKTETFSEPEAKLRDALLEHFLKYPECLDKRGGGEPDAEHQELAEWL